MSSYRFRAFTGADLPLVARWLKSPEVARWWGDPERELELLAKDLEELAMRQWIVEFRNRPFAYAQAYAAAAWSQAHLQHLCADTRMIDAFVCEPDMLGRGHGRTFLRELAQTLIDEGAPAVAIDPAAHNERGRRAYAKAGFEGDKILDTPRGSVILMLFRVQRTGSGS